MAKQETRNGYVKRFNVEKNHKELGRNANYEFDIQQQPAKRMGEDSFANMPSEAIMRDYSHSHNYRSGVVNDFSCGLEDESGIQENKIYKNKFQAP